MADAVPAQDRERLAQLEAENAGLRRRVQEAEQTVEAIRRGEVDAFVVQRGQEERIFSIREAEQAYHAFVEQMRDGAATVAEDGAILYSNKRLGSMLGIPGSELVGTNLLDHVAPEDGYMAEALLRRGLTRDSRGEIALTTATGDRMPTYFTVFPIELEDYRAACVLVQDLTEINRYRYETDKIVELRTAELREENRRLRDVSEAKNHLLAGLAQELQGPVGSLAKVGDDVRDAADKFTEEDRRLVRASGVRLEGLVGDVSLLAEVESGNARIEYGRVNVRTIALDAAAELREAASGKSVEILVDLPPEDVGFVSDPHKIGQTVQTLLSFAIEVSDEGPIRLSAEVTPELVARFAVTIPGQPIPVEDMLRLVAGDLAPDATRRISDKASSLALWTASRTAQFIRGELDVAFDGTSTVFALTVPV